MNTINAMMYCTVNSQYVMLSLPSLEHQNINFTISTNAGYYLYDENHEGIVMSLKSYFAVEKLGITVYR